MKHPMHRVRAFEIVGPYTLSIRFEDDTQQVIDFEAVLRGELYGPLRDPAVFDRVMLDTEARTLVWPNGADFDPATLHDWPHCESAFVEMASRWETVRA
jgi:hypothetical protein